jgi:hypothetical protein
MQSCGIELLHFPPESQEFVSIPAIESWFFDSYPELNSSKIDDEPPG